MQAASRLYLCYISYAMNNITHLECSLCRQRYQAGTVQNLCSCGGPLLVRPSAIASWAYRHTTTESWVRHVLTRGSIDRESLD